MTLERLFRFLPKVKMSAANPDECWEWQGYKDRRGYGWIKYKKENKNFAVHRLAYEHWCGPITHEIDHVCKNHSCLNPRHLEDVTHAVNMRRHFNHLDSNVCVRGHELTPDNVRPYTNANQKARTAPLRLCRECGREDTRRRRAKGRAR
jgi:hypothetical protein